MNSFMKTDGSNVNCTPGEAHGSRSVILPNIVLEDVSSEFETIIGDHPKVNNGEAEDNPGGTVISSSDLDHSAGEMLINTIEVSTEELMGMGQINSEDIEFIYSPNIQFHLESINSSHENNGDAMCEIAELEQVPITLSESVTEATVTDSNSSLAPTPGGRSAIVQEKEPRLVVNQGKVVNEDEISKAILQAASNILHDHGSKHALRLNSMKASKNAKKENSELLAESSFKNVIITNVQGGVTTDVKSLMGNVLLQTIDGKRFAFEHGNQNTTAPSPKKLNDTSEDCGIRSIIISPDFQIANMESQLPFIIETATMAQQTVTAALSAQSALPTNAIPSNLQQGSEMIQVDGTGGSSFQLQKYYCQSGLCRVCLLVKENLTFIFEDIAIDSNGMVENARGPNAAHRFNILAALQTLLDIDVKYNDGLPDKICMECYDQLMNFSVYRKQVTIGQTKLNQILYQVKDSKAPTFIPSLGEEDIQKTEIYRHPASIVTAKNIVQNSQYSHLALRKLSDRVWDKIFSSMSSIVGYKSGKLRNLESYACEKPYVTGFFCYTCNSTVHGSKEDYAQHYDDFHGVKSVDVLFPCDICGNSFPLKDTSAVSQSYSEHWLQHFFLHECTFCSKKLPSSKGLWVHKKSAHGSKEKIFVCSVEGCDKSFFKKTHLETHKRTHLEPSMRSDHTSFCHLCGKKLNSSLTAHINSVHGSERPWRCDICQKTYKRKEILLEHRKSVHLGKNLTLTQFPCTDCGKVFKRGSYLEEHKRTHTGETPFKCPICNKAIRMKPNYFKHMRIHRRKNEIP